MATHQYVSIKTPNNDEQRIIYPIVTEGRMLFGEYIRKMLENKPMMSTFLKPYFENCKKAIVQYGSGIETTFYIDLQHQETVNNGDSRMPVNLVSINILKNNDIIHPDCHPSILKSNIETAITIQNGPLNFDRNFNIESKRHFYSVELSGDSSTIANVRKLAEAREPPLIVNDSGEQEEVDMEDTQTQQAESGTSPRVEVDDTEKDQTLTEESPEPEDKNEQLSDEKSDEIAETLPKTVDLANRANNDAEEKEDPNEDALITQPDNANAVTNTAMISQNEEKDTKANDIFDDTSSSTSSSSSTSTESSNSDEDEPATKDKQKVSSNKKLAQTKQSTTEAAKKTPSTSSNLKMLTPKSNKRKEKDKSNDAPESSTGPEAVDSTVAAKSKTGQTEATTLASLMSPRCKHPKPSDEEVNEIRIKFEGNKNLSKATLREIGRQLNILVTGSKEELLERVERYFELSSEQSEKKRAASPDKAKKKRKVITTTMARKDPTDETNNSHLEV